MKIPKFVKLVMIAAAGALVYTKVLNDDAKLTVKEAAQEVVNNIQDGVSKISGLRPIDMDEDASMAQAWAAEQWDNIGFGPDDE